MRCPATPSPSPSCAQVGFRAQQAAASLLRDGIPVLVFRRRMVHGAESFRSDLLPQQQWMQTSTTQCFVCSSLNT